MSQQSEKLLTLLKELFQLDQPDLDFGFYRIMHAKSVEVTRFLAQDLLSQVREALARSDKGGNAALAEDLREAIKAAEMLGLDPDSTPKVKELRTTLASAVDINALEADVYDHLYRFFRRYYADGDFLTKRVYRPGVYAIPYEGEEVKLHWANADQYYIKTTEHLRDYVFALRPAAADPMRVHFRLVDAAEGEHDNVKAAPDNGRVFLLHEEASIDETVGPDGAELVICFEYRPATVAEWPPAQRGIRNKPPTQSDLLDFAEQRILSGDKPGLARWLDALRAPHTKANGEQADYSRLRAHLNRYTARNTLDYFIHKDLGGFLRRELDFFIKNEVLHIDDIENETASRFELQLAKIKAMRMIAGKVIDFLAQLEGFQKKLWLKKKFVVETSWCVRVGCIPEEFHPEIAANEVQRDEWLRLLALDELETDLCGAVYSAPLTVEFLKAHPTLMLDTRHFSSDFTDGLIEAIDRVDERTDGVLLHSENFQALSLLDVLYRSRIECVYIDPPYNTGDSEILYKNSYQYSCWLTLMENRLAVAIRLLNEDPVLYVAIDDLEMADLCELIDRRFPQLRREMIVVNHHPQGGKARTIANTHEYMLACVGKTAARTLVGRSGDGEVERRPFKRSGTAESNFRYARPNSFYAILVASESLEVVGLERPPQLGADYPTGLNENGEVRVYPISAGSEERVWRRSYESCVQLVRHGMLTCNGNLTIYQMIPAEDRTPALFSNWLGPRFNAGTMGANLLAGIMGERSPFAYPKSLHTVEDAVFAVRLPEGAWCLDFFAGSGTTGQAVINLNREDGGMRKFILVEMGDHFETVLLPRLKKITFAPEWKNGKPSRLATAAEAGRSPRIIKVLRLESYEDALNNLDVRRTDDQQAVLDAEEAQGPDSFTEQYLLRYMLDVETRGSQSLLNVGDFRDPTAYGLRVKRHGSEESQEMAVDLIETFNWLIGLAVGRLAAPRTFTAGFRRDKEGRLRLRGRLRETGDGVWWFRTVSGRLPDGRRALVVWRKRPGGDRPDGIERDNLVLDEWFAGEGYAEPGATFDVVYVNGSSNVESLRPHGETWTVQLIEAEFHRLMFAVDDAA